MTENTRRYQETPLTYKVLLVCSTLTTVLFCWLYVTKPVNAASPISDITPSTQTNPIKELEVIDDPQDSEPNLTPPETSSIIKKTDFSPPSQDLLPGTKTDSESKPIPVTSTSSNSEQNPIPLANSQSTNGLASWEETNDRIQHVITAQDGDQSERIIIEIPVIYETRGLRLAPEQAEEARRILRALQNYKKLITKLHQDGKNISKAWDLLLLDAQPIDALRADSPSLPSNILPTNTTPTEKSAATISIESNQ